MRVYLKSKEAGFTLLETLISVMVSSVILLLLTASIQQLQKMNERVITDAQSILSSKAKVKGSRQIEWHMFLNQLEKYLEETEFVEFTADSITVKEPDVENTLVKYGRSKTGSRSFYRSKNNGHNILLTDIKRFYLAVDAQWLELRFIFQNNEEYKGRIWIESWGKENISEEE